MDAAEYQHDVAVELNELRNELAYQKRLGFFLGAGTSCAINISNISQLTEKIETVLTADVKKQFESVVAAIKKTNATPGFTPTVEDILNHIRLVRKITNDLETAKYEELTGTSAKNLDEQICGSIYKIISEEEKRASLETPKKFVAWLNWFRTDFTKEIFTTNYDLVFEKSLEAQQVPYFDGFIGSYEPFFVEDTLDYAEGPELPPRSWIRLWKVHGSIGWFWKNKKDTVSKRVVRRGVDSEGEVTGKELVIYPSSDKYDSSRRQPYVVYLDRLKKFLVNGEGLFLISGYSFSDEHLNEILFSGLRQNNRLHAVCFCFKDDEADKIHKLANSLMNLSVFAPKKGIFKGVLGEWSKNPNPESDLVKKFFVSNSLSLGDFNQLVFFLLLTSGSKEKIENKIED